MSGIVAPRESRKDENFLSEPNIRRPLTVGREKKEVASAERAAALVEDEIRKKSALDAIKQSAAARVVVQESVVDFLIYPKANCASLDKDLREERERERESKIIRARYASAKGEKDRKKGSRDVRVREWYACCLVPLATEHVCP